MGLGIGEGEWTLIGARAGEGKRMVYPSRAGLFEIHQCCVFHANQNNFSMSVLQPLNGLKLSGGSRSVHCVYAWASNASHFSKKELQVLVLLRRHWPLDGRRPWYLNSAALTSTTSDWLQATVLADPGRWPVVYYKVWDIVIFPKVSSIHKNLLWSLPLYPFLLGINKIALIFMLESLIL